VRLQLAFHYRHCLIPQWDVLRPSPLAGVEAGEAS